MSTPFSTRAAPLGLLLMGWGALSLAGCSQGPDLEAICRAREVCYGGNDADLASCVDLAELRQSRAEARDCGDEFEAAGKCMEGTLSCEPAFNSYSSYDSCRVDSDCSGGPVCIQGICANPDFRPEPGACEAEQNALRACSGEEFKP